MKLILTYAKVFPKKPNQKSDTISIKCQMEANKLADELDKDLDNPL